MKNKKNIFNLLVLVILVTVFVTPFFVSAQGGGGEGADAGSGEGAGSVSMNIKIDNPFKQNTIKGLIEVIVNDILIPIGGVIAVLMIIYAGFLFVTARGSDAQITKAKQALLWAVIGAAILLGAWVISTAVGTTIDQLKKP
jgi:hypothetical protein